MFSGASSATEKMDNMGCGKWEKRRRNIALTLRPGQPLVLSLSPPETQALPHTKSFPQGL